MLEMFKGKPSDRARPAADAGTSEASSTDAPGVPGTPDASGDSTPGDAK
jgi:hypothetical protein